MDQSYVARKIGDETIIVPLRAGIGDLRSIYTLNESGAEIWDMAGRGMPVDGIVESVCQHYEVSEEQAFQDICEFMDDLRVSGLLPDASGSGG